MELQYQFRIDNPRRKCSTWRELSKDSTDHSVNRCNNLLSGLLNPWITVSNVFMLCQWKPCAHGFYWTLGLSHNVACACFFIIWWFSCYNTSSFSRESQVHAPAVSAWVFFGILFGFSFLPWRNFCVDFSFWSVCTDKQSEVCVPQSSRERGTLCSDEVVLKNTPPKNTPCLTLCICFSFLCDCISEKARV